MQILLKNWYLQFIKEINKTSKLRIISPFINEQIIRKVHSKFDLRNLELITRTKLADFAANASSLPALKYAVENGASVFGVKSLHSKVYLFDARMAIVSSANLTSRGLKSNYECGIAIDDKQPIADLHSYFNYLLSFGKPVSSRECEEWGEILARLPIVNSEIISLPDFGASEIAVDLSKRHYVKFIGAAWRRVPATTSSKQVIEDSLCHYAVSFGTHKRPLGVADGDTIYISRMTEFPSDFKVFGKAQAYSFVAERDHSTKREQKERPWKKMWPWYLRLKSPVFIDANLEDCPSLYELIRDLDYTSFPSTVRRFKDGERAIKPFNSLKQQAKIELTPQAVEWLESRFQGAIKTFGKVKNPFLKHLPQSDIDVTTWPTTP